MRAKRARPSGLGFFEKDLIYVHEMHVYKQKREDAIPKWGWQWSNSVCLSVCLCNHTPPLGVERKYMLKVGMVHCKTFTAADFKKSSSILKKKSKSISKKKNHYLIN